MEAKEEYYTPTELEKVMTIFRNLMISYEEVAEVMSMPYPIFLATNIADGFLQKPVADHIVKTIAKACFDNGKLFSDRIPSVGDLFNCEAINPPRTFKAFENKSVISVGTMNGKSFVALMEMIADRQAKQKETVSVNILVYNKQGQKIQDYMVIGADLPM